MEREANNTMFCDGGGITRKLETLRVYRSAYYLLTEEATGEVISDEFAGFLRDSDDAMHDACFYACVNDSAVLLVDTISGDVLWSMNIWEVLEKELELFDLEKGGENHV